MKNYLVLISLLIISINLLAQSHTESFSTCGKTFQITCEAQLDNSIKVTIKDGIKDSVKVQYSIWTRDMDVFSNFFQQHFSDSINVLDSCKNAEKNNWIAYGRQLLQNYLTSLQNTSPISGNLKLQDSVVLHGYYLNHKNDIDTVTTVQKYKVIRLQAEINEGYLENIVAYVGKKNKIIKFTLPFPIGMTSVSNFKKYSDRELYEFKSSPFVISEDSTKPDFFIFLGELIDYDYSLGQRRRDYSPKDTILDMQGNSSLTLHKEETKKLFEAHIFSDFQGLNENKPNGLIQTEIKKRININSIQYLSKRYLYWFFGSYGYFQYISPTVSISKLEQHNKKLLLSDLDSVRLNPGETDTSKFSRHYNRFANGLNLYQYQWFSAGTDFNLFYINNHELKYEIYLNIGARLGFTEVSDSLTTINSSGVKKTGFITQYTVTSFQAYPEIRFNFLPEERFSFSLSHKWIYYKLLSPTIQLTTFDPNNFSKLYYKSSTWLNTSELLMSIQMNPKTNSKVFGRIRFNWESGNIRNNFSQIQIGYSTYILGNK